MGETKFFGYNSDAEYRAEVAKEIAAREAEDTVSKSLSASAFVHEAEGPTADDHLLQATTKLTQALTAHQADLNVNAEFAAMQEMIEGATTPEAAALAVVSFASMHPDYAEHAVEAMQETWGWAAEEALESTVNEIAYAEAVQEVEQETEAWSKHVAHRADVVRDLSNEIAKKDGEAVRQVTAAMASADETLLNGDDVQAVATLFGYRKLAKTGEAAVAKEGFLRAFDDEVERNGYAGRLSAEGERERHRQQQAAITAQMVGFDPETEFRRGHNDALRRVNEGVVGLPFDQQVFEEELRRHDAPPYATPEAIAARDARERADHLKRFGVPLEE